MGVDFHGQPVGVAQVHVKFTVGLFRLLHALDRERVALHVPGQRDPGAACDLGSDLFYGHVFPGLCPLGGGETAVQRRGDRGNAQNDGTLTELLVNDGDKVEAGQVIAKMKVVVTPEQIEALQKAYDEAKVNYDNLEQQVKASMVVSQPVVTSSSTGNVAAAQARLDAAAANKQKMDKLYSIGAVSATQYAEAQSEYAAAQSALVAASTPQVVEQQANVSSAPSKELSEALATAQIQLNQAKAALDQAQSDDNFADITAPVSGIIYLTDFKQGDELKQGDGGTNR